MENVHNSLINISSTVVSVDVSRTPYVSRISPSTWRKGCLARRGLYMPRDSVDRYRTLLLTKARLVCDWHWRGIQRESIIPTTRKSVAYYAQSAISKDLVIFQVSGPYFKRRLQIL